MFKIRATNFRSRLGEGFLDRLAGRLRRTRYVRDVHDHFDQRFGEFGAAVERSDAMFDELDDETTR